MMGDNLRVHAGERISFNVQVVGGQGSTVEIIHNGKTERLVADPAVGSYEETKRFEVVVDGGRHWYRVNLRAPDGTLLVLTNPIYLNFPQPGED